jgi:hypothetical protein
MDTMERGTSTNRVLPGIGSKACGSNLRPKPAVTPPPEPDAQPTCASGQGTPRHALSCLRGEHLDSEWRQRHLYFVHRPHRCRQGPGGWVSLAPGAEPK